MKPSVITLRVYFSLNRARDCHRQVQLATTYEFNSVKMEGNGCRLFATPRPSLSKPRSVPVPCASAVITTPTHARRIWNVVEVLPAQPSVPLPFFEQALPKR